MDQKLSSKIILRLPASIVLLFSIVILLGSCSKKDSNPTTPTDTTKNTDTVALAAYTAPYASDTNFSAGVSIGKLDSVTLVEASGIAASRRYPGYFWTHNDSGNPSDVYLIDSTGAIKAIIGTINYGNRDWEDIAVAPGPDPTQSYIYIGEIGDNNDAHPSSAVYRLPEPDVTFGASVFHATTTVSRIFFSYPDGPHNAETLMVDPLTKDIYIASKGPAAYIYYAKYPQPVDSFFTIKEIARLPFGTLTAGDISSDGMEITMKNYQQIYYWKRRAGETILQTLLRAPTLLPYAGEPQGEALCWSVSGDAYYTTSEYTGSGQACSLIKYKRK
jgi:hypothetical protein